MTAKKVNAEPINDTTPNALTAEDIQMRKPLVIARNEFMQKLIQAANDSGLPFVVMEYVVRDFYEEVRSTAARQYEKDKEDYENALRKVAQ